MSISRYREDVETKTKMATKTQSHEVVFWERLALINIRCYELGFFESW